MRAENWDGLNDVWASGLELAFRDIRNIVKDYPYIAFDTEFPGVVATPMGEFRNMGEFQFQSLRVNTVMLKIIQLGLTFFDERGTPKATYQFNFKFNVHEDMGNQESIDLLLNSGIDFMRHASEGVDTFEFAQLLYTSGLILTDDVCWLCFHAGYDFAYLLKILTEEIIPNSEQSFTDLVKLYFPTVYDIKFLMRSCKSLKGGLQELSDQLKLTRVGMQHTAGSDSLLTGTAFFKMREDGSYLSAADMRSMVNRISFDCVATDKGPFKVTGVRDNSTVKVEFLDAKETEDDSLRFWKRRNAANESTQMLM